MSFYSLRQLYLVSVIMKMLLMKWLKRLTWEDIAVMLFGASFLVGVWYALPMVNTITDVWAFGGGVLRAMEAHTLLPGYGVLYGTLSFYQNYIAMALALGFGLLFYGFDVVALKTALILNPSYSLLVPRVVSALTAIVFLALVYQFLKTHVHSVWWRLTLLMLTFGSVLATLLTRSGKMWMLSIALGMISFIYLYRAITEERKSGKPGRFSAISIVTAFLATANFPFAGLFLINIPILFLYFPRTLQSLKHIGVSVFAGGILLLIVFATNAQNIILQLSGFVLQFFESSTSSIESVVPSLTLFEAFIVNTRQMVEAFPLLLLAFIPALRSGIQNKKLAYLALIYLVVYIVAVSVIFRSDDGLALNVRHIFPIGFFLMFLIAAFKSPPRWVSIIFFSGGLLIYVYTLVLLSIPTTYNRASEFITAQYSQAEIRIDEHIFELTLPMNKASYALFTDASCGSTCKHMRALSGDIAFRPIVVTNETNSKALATLPPPALVVVEYAIPNCTPLVRFGNAVPDNEIFDIDINLGRMLMPSFYTLRQLGKNIYVYEVANCTSAISVKTP